MAQVEFQYEGTKTIIQCQENQKMSEICNNFIFKSNLNENDINYFYDGKGGSQFDKDLTFYQMANSLDKERKKMNILIINNENVNTNDYMIRSKNIICPTCGEDIKIKINNYKIKLFECKNNDEISLPLNGFENTQMINLMNIKCDICKENNKYNTYNNEFYKCIECNKNICLLCKSKHDQNHNIYNYDKLNYICTKHDEKLSQYCKNCKKNICLLCEKEHSQHDKISIIDMILDKNELLMKLNDLKNAINIFNNNIDKIIKILNDVKMNINNYYKLEENIINNYNPKERNYEILYNINELISNNKDIINDINKINNDNNIINQFKNINYIYNKIYEINNEIKIIDKVNKNDIHIETIIYNNGKYVGQMINGIKEGKGIYYFNNGNRYEGDYKNDKREGKGIYYFNNGNKFKGEFKNNVKQGKGIMYYKDGKIVEGIWQNDKLV